MSAERTTTAPRRGAHLAWAFAVLGLLCLAAGGVRAEAPPQGLSLPCTFVNVVDGDTVDVRVQLTFRVRLLDCWAPESHETGRPGEKAAGLVAKQDLAGKVLAKTGTVWIPIAGATQMLDVMTMERVLGRVWVDGMDQDLSEWQRRRGNASRTKAEELARLKAGD